MTSIFKSSDYCKESSSGENSSDNEIEQLGIRIADELMHIETKSVREILLILRNAELFLRNKWVESNFQPILELKWESWFVALQKNFEFLCNIRETESEWFGGVEKKQTNIPTIMPLVVSISLMLIAMDGNHQLFLTKHIDDAIIRFHPAVFMYSIQENDDRLQHTLLAYSTVQKLHQMTFSYHIMFLIFLHQIFYKGSVLVDMLKHDLIAVPLMLRSLFLITSDFDGFMADCDNFKNMILKRHIRLHHCAVATQSKLKSATLVIREALHECYGPTSSKNTRMVVLVDKVDSYQREDIDPLQGDFEIAHIVDCFKEFRNSFKNEKTNSIVKLLDRVLSLLLGFKRDQRS